MLFSDLYKTISSESVGSFRDRGSRFLAFAIPCISEDDVKSHLSILKRRYHDATHHCYAYILGADKSAWRANDDGEPSGTAGRPILGQIQSFDVVNVLIVVVRYYGGTKLGASGLINAYKTAAREALAAAVILERTVNEHYRISFPYESTNMVMRILKEEKLDQTDHTYENICGLSFFVRRNDSVRVAELFRNISGVEITFLKME